MQAADAGVCDIHEPAKNIVKIEKQKNIEGTVFLVLFCLTIPIANWMVGHLGLSACPMDLVCCP